MKKMFAKRDSFGKRNFLKKVCIPSWTDRFPFLGLVVLSVILTIVVEILSRRSLSGGIQFIGEAPLMFGANCLIILTTLSLSLLTTRRTFVTFLLSVFWLALGIVNCVLMSFRVTPLTAIDLAILKSVLSIIQVYLSPGEIIAVAAGVAALVIGILAAWKFLPRSKFSVKHVPITAVMILLFVSGSLITSNASNANDGFENLPDAYENFGFAYCFTTSLIDQGIDRPEGYATEVVEDTIDEIREADVQTQEETAAKPNIIMVQLESFFDVYRLKNVEFSEDPIPVFRSLQSELGSGFLKVPSIGSGTANTEFEILTGMSLDFFGAGEYPYKTVLKNQTCESICYNLKELDYTAHAIHNHQGSFYDRHEVFKNLGFDTFTSLEYMENAEQNEIGWAKDQVLTEEIFKALHATKEQDFIYAISVQAHGKYPDEVKNEYSSIQLENPEDLPYEEKEVPFEYYLTQIQETDAFLGDLTEALAKYEEPTVLVLYGDHLPSLSLEDEDLWDGDRLQTEYIIWNNFGAAMSAEDLSTYQLTAHVLKQLGIEEGTLTQLHQNMSEDADYQKHLELLQYDMLYGNMDTYGGTSPFLPTDLQMGLKEIRVTSVKPCNSQYTYVRGNHFTPFSKVFLNGEEIETHYLDRNTVVIEASEIMKGTVFTVSQEAEDGVILSTSDEWIY
ncbi:MAG: LTA synthase family protein [Clostridiales bacterium]|nr:LTA synthase family protein [Clostridiales bacterium]